MTELLQDLSMFVSDYFDIGCQLYVLILQMMHVSFHQTKLFFLSLLLLEQLDHFLFHELEFICKHKDCVHSVLGLLMAGLVVELLYVDVFFFLMGE